MSVANGAPMQGAPLSKPVGIYYEHPDWYRPLFQQLDKRGVNWVKIHAATHSYDVASHTPEYSLVFNRMSPSAWQRGLGHAIFYTLNYASRKRVASVHARNFQGAAAHSTGIPGLAVSQGAGD
jgi:hypothetical protein